MGSTFLVFILAIELIFIIIYAIVVIEPYKYILQNTLYVVEVKCAMTCFKCQNDSFEFAYLKHCPVCGQKLNWWPWLWERLNKTNLPS